MENRWPFTMEFVAIGTWKITRAEKSRDVDDWRRVASLRINEWGKVNSHCSTVMNAKHCVRSRTTGDYTTSDELDLFKKIYIIESDIKHDAEHKIHKQNIDKDFVLISKYQMAIFNRRCVRARFVNLYYLEVTEENNKN